jgi:hypothetical protein
MNLSEHMTAAQRGIARQYLPIIRNLIAEGKEHYICFALIEAFPCRNDRRDQERVVEDIIRDFVVEGVADEGYLGEWLFVQLRDAGHPDLAYSTREDSFIQKQIRLAWLDRMIADVKQKRIGDRVDTKTHGLGEIVNEELANDRPVGYEPRMVHTGRYGVKLDDAEKHPLYKDGIAYFQPHELRPYDVPGV